MLTTEFYKGIIKPDNYTEKLQERIDRTLEMEDIAYPDNTFFEMLKKLLTFILWSVLVFFILGVIMNYVAVYFILLMGIGIVTLFGLFYINSTLSPKYVLDRMVIRYFDNLKDKEIYAYKGVLEEAYSPELKLNEDNKKQTYFVKIDGHMWQVNKEDFESIKDLKTYKVNLYFVKYNSVGENSTALMVTPADN
ncbi:MAG: hypothetical protein IJS47_05110 [Clostridia bacterium]|nr:hypothetical protein [Clostridia bacterium]